MTDIDNILDERAMQPKKASGDLGSTEEHSIADLIALDKYKQGKAAVARKAGFGLSQFVPQSTVGR